MDGQAAAIRPNIDEEQMEEVDRFCYLGDVGDGGALFDVLARIVKSRSAFESLFCLWRLNARYIKLRMFDSYVLSVHHVKSCLH